MVGINKQPKSEDGTYLRKIRKPLIEKKRRDRMNQSITQLRALIDDTVKQNVAPMTRVDKADILELTVCHLTKLRRQRVAMPTNGKASYATGFQDCAREVTAFLVSNGLIDDSVLSDLSRHLHGTYNRRSEHCAGQHGEVSTPIRSQPVPNVLEGTPYHFSKISPIHSHGYYGNNKSPMENRFEPGVTLENSFYAQSIAASSGSLASRLPLSSIDSPRTSTNTSVSSLEESSSSASFWSSDEHITSSHGDERSVNIGTGSEDKIGHVISESTWRPW